MDERRADIEHEESDTPDDTHRDDEFEQLYNQSLKSFKSGTVVRGRVLQVRSGFVMLDLGYKSDGIIPEEQFTPEELKALKPGDELEVLLEAAEDSNGNLMLSREKAKKLQVWDDLNRAYQTGAPVKGRIVSVIKGGLTVDIGGVEAFLPGSQIDTKPVSQLNKMIGMVLDLRILKMNSGRGNIVLSRRAILEQQLNTQRDKTLSSLVEGQVVTGTIKNVTEYGAFVDLGGIDGLLHITDMSWGRINHPTEMLKVGDTIDVVVLKNDREKQKISLGIKQKTEDPWLTASQKYSVGSRVRGKVMSLADYGAFIELEKGVEGLIHVSEMSWTQRLKHPSKIVAVGDFVEAQVLAVDAAGKRISLGIKQLEPNPWHSISDRYPVGSAVEGKVKTVTDFGAFIGLEDGIDGLIHISDLSWSKHVKHPSDVLKKGQKTKAIVLSIDTQKERISLGLKQLTPDPWENAIPDRYKIGQDETVKVTKKADFGVFVELEHGVEGLIPASEVPKDAPEIKEGDMVNARVIKVDKGERKIALSVKAQIKNVDQSTQNDYINQQEKPDTSIGMLLNERS